MPIDPYYGKKKTYPLGDYYGITDEPPDTNTTNATTDQIATVGKNVGKGYFTMGPLGAALGLAQSAPALTFAQNTPYAVDPTWGNFGKALWGAVKGNTSMQHQAQQMELANFAQDSFTGGPTGGFGGYGVTGMEGFVADSFGGASGADGSAPGDAAAAAGQGGLGTAGEGEGW